MRPTGTMMEPLATLRARVREVLARESIRRGKLLNKAVRDPARFLADARSPWLRRLGDAVTTLGLLPSVDDLHAAMHRPRHVPLGARDRHAADASPVRAGDLLDVLGNRVRGHASPSDARPAALRAILDGHTLATFLAVQARAADGTIVRDAFDVCLDFGVVGDVREATLRVVCAVSGRDIAGSPRRVRVPRYDGAITSCRRGRLAGHVRDVATGASVSIDVLVDERVVSRIDVKGGAIPHPTLARVLRSFTDVYPPRRDDASVVVRVRGTAVPILGTPITFDAPRPTAPPPARAADRPRAVHVVIPVYAGLDVSLRCVDSAARAVNTTPCTITVLYDAGPDQRLLEALRARAMGGEFTLLENPTNLGFVRTCNAGMRLRPDDDVVLLNADTEVSDGWLDRLHAASRSADDVGTVTPFSNAATICSYPAIDEERPLPRGEDVASLAARFAQVNAGETVELPTGHGFCLYIRRPMLDAVGLFDEEAFGRGYGEENDLCLRARAAGFRHLLACDAFVMHVGSVSFGAERDARVRAALATIAARYPTYHEEVADFLRRDPLAPARRRVAVATLAARAAAAPRGTMLLVTHHLGGGVAVHVEDLAARLAHEGWLPLVLATHADDSLRVADRPATTELVYPGARTSEAALVADLRAIGVTHVHVHHVLTAPPFVATLADALGAPYDVTLHDFFLVCPRVAFVRADGTYCGEPDVRTCDACILADDVHEGASYCEEVPADDVAAWRARHRGWLAGARRVFAPSEDTARRMRRALGELVIHTRPHPEVPFDVRFRSPPAPGAPVRVAVLGGIGLHKGYLRLLEVARHAQATGLPLSFVVFGTTADSGALRRLSNVTVTGRYEREALPALVERSACTLALFLSIWPETFSYTLSEAIGLGLYPVSYDLGAPAERLRAFGHGALLPPDTSARAICEALLTEGRRRHDGEHTSPTASYASMTRGYYGLDDA